MPMIPRTVASSLRSSKGNAIRSDESTVAGASACIASKASPTLADPTSATAIIFFSLSDLPNITYKYNRGERRLLQYCFDTADSGSHCFFLLDFENTIEFPGVGYMRAAAEFY